MTKEEFYRIEKLPSVGAYSEGYKKAIDKAKEAFDKACNWLSTYPWYQGVVEEFVKALEEQQ